MTNSKSKTAKAPTVLYRVLRPITDQDTGLVYWVGEYVDYDGRRDPERLNAYVAAGLLERVAVSTLSPLSKHEFNRLPATQQDIYRRCGLYQDETNKGE